MNQRKTDGIRLLPSGRYQIDFRDQGRRRHRESFDRLKEARAALDERRTAVRHKEYVAPARIPTVQEAAAAWIDGKRVSESKHGGPVKRSTIAFWQNHIDRFIVPTLGAYRLDVVDTALIERKREDWRALGLSGKTVNKVLTTLGAIFQKQLALRTIRFNPVAVAERMARGSNEVGADGELDIDRLEVQPGEVYGPNELLRIFDAAEPGFAKTAIQLYAFTGARHGEGLALTWGDVNFASSEVTIRRNWSFNEYREGEPIFSTPKSRRSIRKVHIPDELVFALKKWKLQAPHSRYDLVLPKADGGPQHRKAVWRALEAAIEKANRGATESDRLRRLTVHSLRHAFASIHLMSGTPLPEVSAMLGHANVNITLTVYSHFIPKMQTNAAARFAATIFNREAGSEANHEAQANE